MVLTSDGTVELLITDPGATGTDPPLKWSEGLGPLEGTPRDIETAELFDEGADDIAVLFGGDAPRVDLVRNRLDDPLTEVRSVELTTVGDPVAVAGGTFDVEPSGDAVVGFADGSLEVLLLENGILSARETFSVSSSVSDIVTAEFNKANSKTFDDLAVGTSAASEHHATTIVLNKPVFD